MKRLTYKLDEPVTSKYLHYEYMKIADYDIDKGNCGRITNDMIYNKLGKLEDLEEELGIDILTLFKADKIYFKYFEEDSEIKKSHEVHIDLTNRLLKVYAFPEDEFGTGFSFSSYNFLWALTREELEDKDE